MSINTQSTVVAVFSTAAEAESAANDLKANGFGSHNVFVSSGSPVSSGVTAHETELTEHEGGVKGWFKSLFGNDTESGRYEEDRPYFEQAASSGRSFVSVEVDESNLDTVADILNRHNPVDIHREAGATSYTAEAPATRTSATRGPGARADTVAEGSRAIPVVHEELQVGKRAVLRGGVRVYSRVVEQPVQENINLREEHVSVQRTPVDRATTEADLRAGQEQVFEVKEYAEEPVVSKTARVVEEVRIRKDATERTETVRDTLRNTEVDVENLREGAVRGGSPRQDTTEYIDDADFREDFGRRYAARGATYDTYSPAYQYGYTMANDPRYRGRNFDEVESDLRTDYSTRYPNSTWEKMKDSVRYGWDKLTRKV